MVAYMAEGSRAVLATPQLAHPGGEQPAWGHPGSAVLCQAGLPARGTDTVWSAPGAGTKGYFHSCTLQVCPWPGQTAVFGTYTSSTGVFKGISPAKGHTFASTWLQSSETLELPKGKTTSLFF